ncbi:MAG: hydantoinase/oxoprolinase family protein [Syntrophales bacterium]|nr:hydantoinase/oxoprolinase family protein [Syntrophales bacterium]
MDKKEYWVGVDTGGTFTDCVVIDQEGAVTLGKASSTPRNFAVGILDSVNAVAEELGITSEELLRNTKLFSHGTTVATNATITLQGAKVGLITTKGFEDTIFIMRGKGRVDGLLEMEIRHETAARKPPTLLPRRRVRGVTERIDCFGKVVVPLNLEEVKQAIRELVEDEGVESIAVCLLWSFAHPEHERIIKQYIQKAYPGIYITVSHEVRAAIHEYARSLTTVIDAFVGPLTRVYFDELEKDLQQKGYKGPLMIMQSHGGVVEKKEVVPVFTAVSGPAGGVVGSRYWGEILGIDNIISTDVGGTSFDVSLIPARERIFAKEPYIGRYRVLIPTIDIVTIGAGGGSIAWVDEATNTLKVGPLSAGADPGPVCYGKGGAQPTVTDADIILGYIDPGYFLGGKTKVDGEASRKAIFELGKRLGLDTVETAAGIYDIQNEHMSDLIRSVMIERGYDPRDFSVFAFGGGGPTHGATYGPENGVKRVVMFPYSSVFSAYGIATADVIHSAEMSRRYRLPADAEEINSLFEELEAGQIKRLMAAGFKREEIIISKSLKMRYGLQVHEISVPLERERMTAESVGALADRFEARYEEIYGKGTGYREAGIDIVSFELEAIGPIAKPKLKRYEWGGADSSGAIKTKRDVYFRKKGGFVKTNIYRMEKLKPGNRIEGPAVIEVPTTTVVVLPEQVAKVDEYLNIIIE